MEGETTVSRRYAGFWCRLVAFSLDGVGSIHDTVRGIPGAFARVIETIDSIIKDKSRYCDSYDIGCTVTKHNVNNLVELDAYAERKNYNMKYRLGIANKRIESDQLLESFSVVSGSFKHSATEFFHYQMNKTKNLMDKFKYFSIFYWLTSKKHKRLLGCQWKESGVTLDARGNLYYCAVASDKIGSLREGKGEEFFFADKNIEYRKSIIRECCNECIHDYAGSPELKNVIFFLKHLIASRISMYTYKIKAMIMK